MKLVKTFFLVIALMIFLAAKHIIDFVESKDVSGIICGDFTVSDGMIAYVGDESINIQPTSSFFTIDNHPLSVIKIPYFKSKQKPKKISINDEMLAFIDFKERYIYISKMDAHSN